MRRAVLWVGLGAFAVMAAGFLWLITRYLGMDDPADLLAADEQERGATVPFPTPEDASRGRHRAAR